MLKILFMSKTEVRKWLPAVITKHTGSVSFHVKLNDGREDNVINIRSELEFWKTAVKLSEIRRHTRSTNLDIPVRK